MKHPNPIRLEDAILDHPVLPHAEWIAARKELLEKERELTHLGDEVNAARRALPWEKVTKDFTFQGPGGPLTLAELFGGKRQLIIYHFMLAPGWEEGCVGCSHLADHFDGARRHFEQADVSFVAVSRGTLPELEAFKKRMGWSFRWVSSHGTDFNTDYGVSFTPEQVATGDVGYNYGTTRAAYEELPGMSVFYQDEAGNVFHTYSAYARGLDILVGSLRFLDLTPKGRCDGEGMEDGWLRYHDKYQSEAAASCCGCQ
ncbi:MAG: thioredoxin family protein [Verrucomicrobiota bacterium]